MIDWKKLLIGLAILIAILAIIKSCEQEPKIVTRTVTKIVKVHDTIYDTFIQKVPEKVYVTKTVTKKGKDSIIYLDKPTDSSIQANKYLSVLKSNNAQADLQVTTTGELLDVQGTITYPEKETTTTITKVKPMSGLFIYGSAPLNVNNLNPELGLMYQFKNSLMVSGAVQYNNYTKSADLKIGVGIKIF